MPLLWHSSPTLLLLPAYISAVSLECNHIRAGGVGFNLEKLGGPKTVHELEWDPPSITNTTYTINICKQLSRDKNVDKDKQCPIGTWVCGVEYDYPSPEEVYVRKVIPIAGQFTASHGTSRALDPKFTRLKDSATNSDPDKEGIVIELHGGKYPDQRTGRTQKAIVEFVCDRDLTGNEGFEDAERMLDVSEYSSMRRREEADEDDGDDEPGPELPDLDGGKSLKFISYKPEGDYDVLRLRWNTKYACEGAIDEDDDDDDSGKKPSGGWGFFTWFIIILFLLAAAYIIFGSWLNYNRYGARGWDLIPHGDTIRDIPYVLQDWGRGLIDRFRGDSRGGYSAV